MGEKDPLLARLLAAATAGASPAGPAHKRSPVRIVLDPDATPASVLAESYCRSYTWVAESPVLELTAYIDKLLL